MPQGPQEHSLGRFEAPQLFLADLDADATAKLITTAADVVLVVDDDGVIRDLAFGSDELLGQGYQRWIGQPWSETVTVESRPKVEAMLKEACQGHIARWRHVNHAMADGTDLPLSYAAVQVRNRAKRIGPGRAHTIVFGRDLRTSVALQQRLVSAQQSMESDYWRLRHVETRYRLLFQVASEAVLILDAATEKLEEANPAAYTLLGAPLRRSAWTLPDSLDATSIVALRNVFAKLRTTGRADPLTVRLNDNSDGFTVTVSLFRQENSTHFLLSFTPRPGEVSPGSSDPGGLLSRVIDSAPDAFVATSPDGRVLQVNRAFLDLAQLSTDELARGESLDKWLGRSGVDLNVLLSNLRQRGTVRLFATRMLGTYGLVSEVEISAVSITSGEQPLLGFTIRDVGRRLPNDARPAKELPRSAGQMTELVGRVPLRDIVRETTDLIEQLCIEAALELTGDNRASAAEMLGLSRQSLYVKLRRFGAGDPVAQG